MKIARFDFQTEGTVATTDDNGTKRILRLNRGAGPDQLLKGNMNLGYFGWYGESSFHKDERGFITRQDIKDALTMPSGFDFGTDLADDGWLKFAYKGKILLVAKQPITRSISWESIYMAGAVYGSGTTGPYNTRYQVVPPDPDAKINVQGADVTDVNTNAGGNTQRPYKEDGDHEGKTSYDNGEYYIWWDGTNTWNISDTKGGGTIQYSRTDASPYGSYDNVNGAGDVDAYEITGDLVTQNATITKGGFTYKIRLMQGAEDNPSASSGREWNDLMYRVSADDPLSLGGDLWDDFTDGLEERGICVGNDENGRASWCQETHATSVYPERRVYRGSTSVGSFFDYFATRTTTFNGWRPVLELITQ